MARSITDPYRQVQALTAVDRALAESGQHEQAETLARSITDPDGQARALTAVAKALVAWGDTRQAHHVAWVWLFSSEVLLVPVRLGGEEASVPYVPGV